MTQDEVDHGTARQLRRDAARNRERLLEAAREVFAQRGLGAALDDVAHRAGVGVGTLYRRFPDRTALVEALFERQVNDLVRIADEAATHTDSWRGLTGAVHAIATRLAEDRGLRDVIVSAAHVPDALTGLRDRLLPAMGVLVERAHRDGVLRPDVGTTDFPLIQFMIDAVAAHTAPVDQDIWQRYLSVVVDGLRARPGLTWLTPPPPSSQQMAAIEEQGRRARARHGPERT